jgi:hypothetical protein
MLSVCASFVRKSSASAKSTSSWLPSEITLEKPRPSASAQSSIALTSPPDCDTSAIAPGRAAVPANDALSPIDGRSRPSELGPSTRMR